MRNNVEKRDLGQEYWGEELKSASTTEHNHRDVVNNTARYGCSDLNAQNTLPFPTERSIQSLSARSVASDNATSSHQRIAEYQATSVVYPLLEAEK